MKQIVMKAMTRKAKDPTRRAHTNTSTSPRPQVILMMLMKVGCMPVEKVLHVWSKSLKREHVTLT